MRNFLLISKYLSIVLCLLIGIFLFHSWGFAQTLPTWEIEIDGVPIWITIIHSGDDSNNGGSQVCQQWWECGNTTTDAYIFAINQPDNVRLILDFDQENDAMQAKLYVAGKDAEPLEYQVSESNLKVLNDGGWPYLIMETLDGQWVNSTGPSYNLNIDVDGNYNLREYGNPDNKTDGTIDFTINIRAADSGEPLWQTIQVTNDPFTPEQRSWSRFIGWLRMPGAPEFRIRDPFIPTFPLLGLGSREGSWLENNPFPIFFNLEKMEFYLRPFVTYQIGGSYAVNSSNPPPNVNFEAPFAFYNFDPNSRQAHLVVRGAFTPADTLSDGSLSLPRLGVRYSWKTDDDQLWRYGLQLSDFHAYTDHVMIGDTEIIAVEPESFPEWVTSKPWRVVTFIEATNGYQSSEGIYFYAADSEDWPWLAGTTDAGAGYLQAPLLQESNAVTISASRTLPVGFRGEYMFAYNEPPKLYLSTMDNRLHLLGVHSGIWYLGQGNILRVTDLNQDGAIDSWVREKVPPDLDKRGLQQANPGQVMETIFDAGEYLFHSRPGTLEIVQSGHEQVAFTIEPPTDKESWEAFRNRLRPYEADRRDPTDLGSWLENFPDPRSAISGASLTNLRMVGEGFRFELALGPNYRVVGPDLLGLAGLTPGEYLVENQAEQFTITALTPSQLSLEVPQSMGESTAASVWVSLHNRGLADAPGLSLVTEVVDSQGVLSELSRQPVAVLGDQAIQVQVENPPALEQGFALRLRLENSDGRTLIETTLPEARKSNNPDLARRILGLSTSEGYRPGWLLGLALIATVPLVVLRQYRLATSRRLTSEANSH